MPAKLLDRFTDDARAARDAAEDAADHGQRIFNEAVSVAEKTVSEAVKAAERVLKDALHRLGDRTRDYGGVASGGMEDAQRYVVERVRERPVTATLVGLGAGLLIGLLLSNRDQ